MLYYTGPHYTILYHSEADQAESEDMLRTFLMFVISGACGSGACGWRYVANMSHARHLRGPLGYHCGASKPPSTNKSDRQASCLTVTSQNPKMQSLFWESGSYFYFVFESVWRYRASTNKLKIITGFTRWVHLVILVILVIRVILVI